MLIAPYLQGGLTIRLQGEPVSKPYIEMTAKLMREFGVDIAVNYPEIVVKEGKYANKTYFVENDWSAASYIYQSFLFSQNLQKMRPGFPFRDKNKTETAIRVGLCYVSGHIMHTYKFTYVSPV